LDFLIQYHHHNEKLGTGNNERIVRSIFLFCQRSVKLRNHILEDLVLSLQGSVSCASRLVLHAEHEDGLTLQIGRDPNALVSISICDPRVPSFAVTYPRLRIDRRGAERFDEHTATDVLTGGVRWFVRKVFRYGFVPPEGYRKRSRNTAKAEQTGCTERRDRVSVDRRAPLARRR
jgi:hypothetical protein